MAAVQPGRAADTAGAVRGLGAIYPPHCYGLPQRDNPQPSDDTGNPASLALHGSAPRSVPGSCLSPMSSTLHTPASGAADARRWTIDNPPATLKP